MVKKGKDRVKFDQNGNREDHLRELKPSMSRHCRARGVEKAEMRGKEAHCGGDFAANTDKKKKETN